MNQKNNSLQMNGLYGVRTPRCSGSRSASVPIHALQLLVIAVVLALAFSPGSSHAQENFTRPGAFNPPPTTTIADHPQLVPINPSAPESLSFPDSVTPFDPNVRLADLNVAAHDDASHSDGSLASTIDSAATMISTMKDGVSEKTSGWLTALKTNGSWQEQLQAMFGSTDIGRMLGSLALVLGGYFTFIWLMKKINPSGNSGLPAEVIEILGCVPFGPRKNLQLVRLGSKLLLLMNDTEGTRPIGEITDESEVEYLTSLCLGKRKPSSRPAFRRSASRTSEPPAAPSPTSRPPVAATETIVNLNTNLANILRSLENATRQPGTSFEA